MSRVALSAAICTLLVSALATAQSNLATLTGIVTDASSAAVADAQVSVTSTTTGLTIRVNTNQEGIYLIPNLPPAPYTLEVQAQGFKRKTVRNVVLDAAMRARQDVQIEVGDVQQSVEVLAAVTPLQAETAEISETVTSKDIINMPLNGRAPYSLLMLSTGVSAAGDDPSSLDYAGGLSLNGSRRGSNAYVVDGASTTHIGGIGERIGSIEAIQEFKVLANAYSAEFGRTSGGVISFQMKSGTKDFHGSAYEFHRNAVLNANNWENNNRNIGRGQLIRNEFGVTAGGPVPKMRGRMFYFLSYEGIRDSIPVTRLRTIPDPAVRAGNFSRIPVPVFDPTNDTPFPNNSIPTSRLDGAAQRFMNLFPAPNQEGIFNARFGLATNNFVRQAGQNDNKNFGTVRVDYSPTDRDKIFVTFSHVNEGPRDLVRDFDNVLNTTIGPRFRNIRRMTVGYTRMLSSSMGNELLLSSQRDPRKISPWYPDFDVTRELGMRNRTGTGLPTLSIAGGYGNYGESNFQDWVHQPSSIGDIMSVQRGRHSMRFGGQLYQNQFWYIAANNTSGNYSFNGEITGRGTVGRNNPINALADMLLGAVKTAGYPIPQIPVNRYNYNLGIFFQDDWKVTQKLTLNLGVRYEFETNQAVKNNVYSRLDMRTGDLLVAGRNATRNLNLNNDKVNFGPRIGIAYSLTPKTILRTGFGAFYSNLWVNNGEMVSYTGWTNSQTFVDQGVGRAQPFGFAQGFPVDGVTTAVPDPLALFAEATVARPLAAGGFTYDPNGKLPVNYQWNASVQREAGLNTVVELAYVASRSTYLSRNVPANSLTLDQAAAVSINRVPAQQLRAFNRIAGFNAILYDGLSHYHSLQAKATRRFNRGFSLDANYTYSKNIDNASTLGDSFQIPWQFNAIERALSGFDRTHSVVAGVIYELPFGKGRRFANSNQVTGYLVGGWQVNALFSASSGLPFTITQINTNLVLSAQRPDLIDPNNPAGVVAGTVFEGAARRFLIAPNAAGFPFRASSNTGLGNLGRNTGREPGFVNWNASLFKAIPIKERLRFEVRLEAYNAFNTVNWREPSSANIDNANYGIITGTAPARQVQIGGRLSW
ncbi:MAG: TonB-dependent receptor [Bryobacterales bacterium]|nr:TonB-dependent receptor [Bryobacterales bacterium]